MNEVAKECFHSQLDLKKFVCSNLAQYIKHLGLYFLVYINNGYNILGEETFSDYIISALA